MNKYSWKEAALSWMESVYLRDTSYVYIFPFFKINMEGRIIVEIYVWDCMADPVFRCYVIQDGAPFDEIEEKEFFRLVRMSPKTIYFEETLFRELHDGISNHFPEWNYNYYYKGQEGMALEHLYYCVTRAGCKEILYKAGLEVLAFYLESIPGINLEGSTPERIINHGLPLKLLRCLNYQDSVEWLFCNESIADVRSIYHKYGGFIAHYIPTRAGWDYLKYIVSTKGQESNEKLNEDILVAVETVGNSMLDAYKKYRNLQKEIPELRELDFLDAVSDALECEPECIEDFETYLDNLVLFRKGEKRDVDGLFEKRYQETDYEFEKDEYAVIMPRKGYDIILEGLTQHNCVADYMERHAHGDSTILFVRQRKCRDKSYLTMEVAGGRIVQVHARYNEGLKEEDRRFLREYAEAKWLDYYA